MPQATYTFPTGFLWGSATASHQVEGKNTNNAWALWESQPGRIANGDKAGLADDWWGGRWRDDLDRAAETGQNAHRFSVEWSRIQPSPDRWNEDALDVYREMLRGMGTRGMTPIITLHHFNDPLWFYEMGGWENPDAPALFEKFARKVVETLRDQCTLWIPINEPNVFVYMGYMGSGEFPPGKHSLRAAGAVMANLVRGQARAYRAIKGIQRESRVGSSVNYRHMRPAHPGFPLDRWVANTLHNNYNASFFDALLTGRLTFALGRYNIPEAKGAQDFLGLNYYTTDLCSFNPFNPMELFSKRRYDPRAPLSDGGFIAHEPRGLFDMLRWANHRYKLPLIITENGVNDASDALRPRYLVEHIHQMWRAITFTWPGKGYFHWSLVDNFEW